MDRQLRSAETLHALMAVAPGLQKKWGILYRGPSDNHNIKKTSRGTLLGS